jgi:hypothetical protein
MTCDNGHQTFTIIQQVKYEILSELAVSSICDGYYRESVASFASALERLYEHFVEVACRARCIGNEEFSAAWKPLRKSSERQLGSFAILHLVETGRPAALLANKHVSFRNSVIHAGVIPDRSQAVAYGQAVGECAEPIIALLRTERYQEAQRCLIFDSLRERARKAQSLGARHSTLSMSTPFSFVDGAKPFDLEKLLIERANRPSMDEAVAQSHALARLIELFQASQPQPANE